MFANINMIPFIRSFNYFRYTLAILVLFAYLIFINLNQVPFWDDEASGALVARNLINLGTPSVFDGRNLYWAVAGETSQDLQFLYPQLINYFFAGVFYLFGEGEIQARAIVGLFALMAMILFWDCLRLDFPHRRGFATLALTLLCFSPMILLYSRSATYNIPAMFCAILLFRLYLSYCKHAKISTACAMLATALVGFHFHWLLSASFITALAIFHCCFRLQALDRRLVILVVAAIPYVLQLGYILFFVSERTPNIIISDLVWYEHAYTILKLYFLALNENGILFWTIALWFFCHRSYLLLATANKAKKSILHTQERYVILQQCWTNLRNDKVFQYLVLVILVTMIIALTSVQPIKYHQVGDVRYLITIVPFAIVVSAEVVWRAWHSIKIAGVTICIILLISNVAGWPLLRHVNTGAQPRWTLPELAIEFHRDFPNSMRTIVNYLDNETSQDDFIYVEAYSNSVLLYYLSDKLYFTGVLKNKNFELTKLKEQGLKYMFFDEIIKGNFVPKWLVVYGRVPNQVIGQVKLHFAKNLYQFQKSYNMTWYNQRPEPRMHDTYILNSTGPEEKISIYRLIEH